MATAADIRTRLRTRLEEATAAVWTDDELDECVNAALDVYGRRFPVEVITTAAVSDGATSVAAPTGLHAIQRVILADGTVVPRRRVPSRSTSGEELAWELYAGLIHLSQPLTAQTLTIWHTATVTLATLPATDEGLIVLGAIAIALEARAIQDYKRGGPLAGDDADLITAVRDEFTRALDSRGRRVRDGVVG
jgi:hypothetical protein